MDPKKDRRVRKIEVPTDSVLEFELRDTAADIQRRREEKEAREREEEAEGGGQQGGGQEGGREWQKRMEGKTKVTQN